MSSTLSDEQQALLDPPAPSHLERRPTHSGARGVAAAPPSFDPIPPPYIAHRAEDVGVAKARLSTVPTFLLATLAGAFIAMGAVAATIAMTTTGGVAMPWGATRLLGGLAFCLGLILVVLAGAELFTGNNLMVMAYVSGKLRARHVLRNWLIVYFGNFTGSITTAGLVFLTGQYQMAGGGVGQLALTIAEGKCGLTVVEALTRGIYCNALVCLAVWLCMSARSTTDKLLAILFPITAFVASGFEHSIANMYFIPIGLLIRDFAPAEFWQTLDTSRAAFQHLGWDSFLLANLLPVTIGNVIGGAVFVGFIYWVIYRHRDEKPAG